MPTYAIKLKNDNGHITGCGTMTIQIKAADRKTAQRSAVEWAKTRFPQSAWRLHDTESDKA